MKKKTKQRKKPFLQKHILKIVENHKHLGVTISLNNKWSKHIINSALKQISYLRKLKFQLPKNTLNKLYCTYISPLYEYASEVWDGCNLSGTNRLEEVQLNAARIVTGHPVFSSLRSLYLETGWGWGNASWKKENKTINSYVQNNQKLNS